MVLGLWPADSNTTDPFHPNPGSVV